MNSITFTCEVVTPMFLAGADGKTPELRPPSIKGAMRFWWRAMHGHLPIDDKKDGDGNIIQKGLRTQEAEIFGGGGEAAKRSGFHLRVLTGVREMAKQGYQPLPHHTGGNNCIACNANNNRCKKSFEFQSITGDNFDVKISGADLEMIENLFVLTCVFGGFGKRSRRGFGSVKIVKRNDVDFLMPNDLESIYSYLSKFNNDYQYDRTDKKILLVRPVPLNDKYEITYPYLEEVRIGDDYGSDFQLVERIGKSSHKYQTDSNGSANPRFSSPTYVSALKIQNQYYPIISSLYLALPNTIHDSSYKKTRRHDFQRAILDKSLSLD